VVVVLIQPVLKTKKTNRSHNSLVVVLYLKVIKKGRCFNNYQLLIKATERVQTLLNKITLATFT
jgi:hypothetical protein